LFSKYIKNKKYTKKVKLNIIQTNIQIFKYQKPFDIIQYPFIKKIIENNNLIQPKNNDICNSFIFNNTHHETIFFYLGYNWFPHSFFFSSKLQFFYNIILNDNLHGTMQRKYFKKNYKTKNTIYFIQSIKEPQKIKISKFENIKLFCEYCIKFKSMIEQSEKAMTWHYPQSTLKTMYKNIQLIFN
jgi:hypothetical protein